MQQRRGTAAQWTVTNPVLEAGELGFESDTTNLKIGDGSTSWDDLPYVAEGVPGPQGEQGIQGATGATGPSGAQGPKGDSGDDGADGLPGVVNGISPITYDSETKEVGIDQSLISINSNQVVRTLEIFDTSHSISAAMASTTRLGASAAATTVTVTNDLQIGERIDYIRSSGEIIFTPFSGVTLISPGTKRKLKEIGSACTVIKVANNSYHLFGDLVV
jgi:hypothetical protein